MISSKPTTRFTIAGRDEGLPVYHVVGATTTVDGRKVLMLPGTEIEAPCLHLGSGLLVGNEICSGQVESLRLLLVVAVTTVDTYVEPVMLVAQMKLVSYSPLVAWVRVPSVSPIIGCTRVDSREIPVIMGCELCMGAFKLGRCQYFELHENIISTGITFQLTLTW